MNKDNQIKELAELLCTDCTEFGSCKYANGGCEAVLREANLLYNAGYRQLIECTNDSRCHPVDEFICSNCGFITRDCCRYEIDEDADPPDENCYEFEFKYCPRCGSKVK